MQTLADQFAASPPPSLTQVTVPDLWQQDAVVALRAGHDVVVHAPTGAGKTLVFELWSNFGKPRGQAIYTVPTRALANDKLAEWRSHGWEVGIATGDLSENLEAPVVVATLETQKNRLIRGEGPTLLVVDEYQMLADEDRGLNYELAIALAPAGTQLLLLSGSVANPQDIVKWLTRLGRRATLIRHEERPVPLEEVFATNLSYHIPSEVRGYWPRLVAKALAENLGPVLLFAPRRSATEELAAELARYLPPPPVPLTLTTEQKALVGDHLARLLARRVAYHHSGLSYGARAGVIEPLAKAGALRAVVATMGLAAGINFSLRSVALAGDSYRRDQVEHPLRPDEILQMFGSAAGRRGIDETGYVLVAANEIRLRDGYPAHLSRSGMVDWNALIGVMHAAAEAGLEPFAEAVRIQQRLFTTKPVVLGVEESLKHPQTPCGLKTDAERGRHVRKLVKQILNSRGEWENWTGFREVPAKDVMAFSPQPAVPAAPSPEAVPADVAGSSTAEVSSPDSSTFAVAASAPPQLRPALTVPAALEKLGQGGLTRLPDGTWCRTQTVAEILNGPRVLLAKWVRKLTHWNGRQTSLKVWEEDCVPILQRKLSAQKTPLLKLETVPFAAAATAGAGEFESFNRRLTQINADNAATSAGADEVESDQDETPASTAPPSAALPDGSAPTELSRTADGPRPQRRSEEGDPRENPGRSGAVQLAALGDRARSDFVQEFPARDLSAGSSDPKRPAPPSPSPGPGRITGFLSLAELPLRVVVDRHGVALWKPPEREVMPTDCARCELTSVCRNLSTLTGVAMLWRRLGLVDAAGRPTRRGRVMSFFHQGDGLAIAAGLEDDKFPIDDFVYELANLRGGFRFTGENARWGGRLAMACQRVFGLQSVPGYLEHGLPVEYGAGADEVVRAIHANPLAKNAFITDFLGAGDIDRGIIEWRSLLRQVSHSPPLDWPRWTELQARAKAILAETDSPTLTDLPPLDYQQTRRVEHRLVFRRH